MPFGIGSMKLTAHHAPPPVAATSSSRCSGPRCAAPLYTRVTCYTPKSAEGTVSCLIKSDADRCTMTNNADLVTIPSNAIIDSVEFHGVRGFSTKDDFSIGLGQLNMGVTFPLIEDANDEIANSKIGGCRQFLSVRPDGRTDKNLVLYPSNVNVAFGQPVIAGGLAVTIVYHTKPTAL